MTEAAGDFTDVYNGGAGLVLKTPAIIPASCGGTLFTAPNVINPACITGDGAAIQDLYTTAAKLSTLGGLPTAAAASNLTFNLPEPGKHSGRCKRQRNGRCNGCGDADRWRGGTRR